MPAASIPAATSDFPFVTNNSDSGGYFISIDAAGVVCLWDAASGQCEARAAPLELCHGICTAAVRMPDGNRVALLMESQVSAASGCDVLASLQGSGTYGADKSVSDVVTAVIIEWASLRTVGVAVMHTVQQLVNCPKLTYHQNLAPSRPHTGGVTTAARAGAAQSPSTPAPPPLPTLSHRIEASAAKVAPRGQGDAEGLRQHILCVTREGQLLAALHTHESATPQSASLNQEPPSQPSSLLGTASTRVTLPVLPLQASKLACACFSPDGASLLVVTPEAWCLLVDAAAIGRRAGAAGAPVYVVIAASERHRPYDPSQGLPFLNPTQFQSGLGGNTRPPGPVRAGLTRLSIASEISAASDRGELLSPGAPRPPQRIAPGGFDHCSWKAGVIVHAACSPTMGSGDADLQPAMGWSLLVWDVHGEALWVEVDSHGQVTPQGSTNLCSNSWMAAPGQDTPHSHHAVLPDMITAAPTKPGSNCLTILAAWSSTSPLRADCVASQMSSPHQHPASIQGCADHDVVGALQVDDGSVKEAASCKHADGSVVSAASVHQKCTLHKRLSPLTAPGLINLCVASIHISRGVANSETMGARCSIGVGGGDGLLHKTIYTGHWWSCWESLGADQAVSPQPLLPYHSVSAKICASGMLHGLNNGGVSNYTDRSVSSGRGTVEDQDRGGANSSTTNRLSDSGCVASGVICSQSSTCLTEQQSWPLGDGLLHARKQLRHIHRVLPAPGIEGSDGDVDVSASTLAGGGMTALALRHRSRDDSMSRSAPHYSQPAAFVTATTFAKSERDQQV